jgi:hypothetical protein
MTGGLMQLVSYGSQDIYLTGNPQTTFFKYIYKRHTNFSTESIEQSYLGSAKMGRNISATISRNGDLLQRVYLEIEMDNKTITSPYYGFQLIDRIELDIGNQIIETLQGEWLLIWTDLTHNIDQQTMINNIIGNTTNEMYIPIPFYFSINPGLALPLIALQYHEVRINIYFKNKTDISGAADIDKCSMWCDYIYLDTTERKLFAINSHEYLIEQLQYITTKIPITQKYIKQDLKFVNPIKELIWVVQDISNSQYDLNRYEKIDYATIYMNGIERFKKRKGNYFIYLQRYNNHSGSGNTNITPNIHTYTFALDTENHSPSGSCNFSRINSVELHIDFNPNNLLLNTIYRCLNVYGRSYNILRIMGGMAGIAYSL